VGVNGVCIGDSETTMKRKQILHTKRGMEDNRTSAANGKKPKDHRATWLDYGGSSSNMAAISGKSEGGSLETAASVIALKQESSFL
jgi:hypothetical protein